MLGHFLKPEYEELIAKKDWESLRVAFEDLDPPDIAEVLDDLPPEDSGVIFRILPRDKAGVAFEYLPLDQQAELVGTLSSEQLVNILNEMAPDDRTRLFSELPAEVTKRALTTLKPEELKVARKLLGYPDDTAGRFMTPEYLAIRPEMTASQALDYVRSHGRGVETTSVLYVVDDKGILQSDVRLGELVMADPSAKVAEIPHRSLVSLSATMPKSEVVPAFEKYDRVALPVVDSTGVMLGIITIDDVLDVAEQEATNAIQKMAAVEVLEAPYLEIGFLEMVRKRGVWLAILFVSEMLTSTAMSYFEGEISKAVVLVLFIPLIMSSGGNSGSQATSLIIRSLAIRELSLADWWRVLLRELRSGLALGVLLGTIGFLRISLWPYHTRLYGQHYLLVAATVFFSLIGVVLFGSVAGSMLPFILRRVGLDPASASAPFVATLVDVTGLIIYFMVASVVLLRALVPVTGFPVTVTQPVATPSGYEDASRHAEGAAWRKAMARCGAETMRLSDPDTERGESEVTLTMEFRCADPEWDLAARAKKAELIVVGRVREVAPAPPDAPVPPGGPWWVAQLEATRAVKGTLQGETLTVLARGRTGDTAPLFAGQRALLLLHPEGDRFRLDGPADVRGPDAEAEIPALLK